MLWFPYKAKNCISPSLIKTSEISHFGIMRKSNWNCESHILPTVHFEINLPGHQMDELQHHTRHRTASPPSQTARSDAIWWKIYHGDTARRLQLKPSAECQGMSERSRREDGDAGKRERHCSVSAAGSAGLISSSPLSLVRLMAENHNLGDFIL